MYKTLSNTVHFRAQEGSHAVRATQRGYGGKSLVGDPVRILPTLKQQFDIVARRLQELPALISAAPDRETAEHLRREMAGKLSNYHNMRKIIYHGCMQALERCFMTVAKARLPEDLYAELLAEAQHHWTTEGYPEFIPPPNKQERRRASRKTAYRNWKNGGQS